MTYQLVRFDGAVEIVLQHHDFTSCVPAHVKHLMNLRSNLGDVLRSINGRHDTKSPHSSLRAEAWRFVRDIYAEPTTRSQQSPSIGGFGAHCAPI